MQQFARNYEIGTVENENDAILILNDKVGYILFLPTCK